MIGFFFYFSEADVKNDQRSTDRSLTRSLFLTTNVDGYWTIPVAYHQEGENLRQTAERALKANLGDEFEAKILGNSPFSHFKYGYSQKIQDKTGAGGENVFIFKAFYEGGKVQLQDKERNKDYLWLQRDELEKKIDPVVKKPLFKIIYDEE